MFMLEEMSTCKELIMTTHCLLQLNQYTKRKLKRRQEVIPSSFHGVTMKMDSWATAKSSQIGKEYLIFLKA
jgi:hypothetical protein